MIALELLWTYFTEILYLIFLGALIVIVVIFLPQGITGLLKGLSTKKFVEIKLKHDRAPGAQPEIGLSHT